MIMLLTLKKYNNEPMKKQKKLHYHKYYYLYESL